MKIEDVLKKYNVEYHTEGKHTRQGWIQLNCPFCEGPLYLGYNLANKYFNCWRCGPLKRIGTLAAIIQQPWNVSKKLFNDLIPEHDRPTKQAGKLVLPAELGPLLKCHKDYLRERGYKIKELERLWKIQGIGRALHLKWRIFIPIYHGGRVVSWTTRSISDKVEARYISASPDQEAVRHKTILYGEDYVRHSIIVHEGPLDVWRTGPGAVATLGTGFVRSQVAAIAKYHRRIICFDNEPKAMRRAEELADLLEGYPGETYVVQLDSKDPGTASDREVQKLRRLLNH